MAALYALSSHPDLWPVSPRICECCSSTAGPSWAFYSVSTFAYLALFLPVSVGRRTVLKSLLVILRGKRRWSLGCP